MNAVTVLIVARDAAATIQRAVRSALASTPDEILMVDDWSSDGTADLARAAAPALRVVRPTEHRTLGFARQTGIESLGTPIAVCLDADDELLPGRVARMAEALTETDLAADAIELRDGRDGSLLRTVGIPAFLRRDPLRARLFERNYLPAPGPLGLRREAALRIGYDGSLHDDFDFVLRSLAARHRLALLAEPGYRQYATPSSMSRNLATQRQMYRLTLMKHAYADVQRLYEEAGWPTTVTWWALASMATFREDYGTALDFTSAAERSGGNDASVIETDGPCRRPERWRVAFCRGTLMLLMGEDRAGLDWLVRAAGSLASAETENNLGVALARAGRDEEARRCFRRAADLYPGYADAAANLADLQTNRITTHPMRQDAARDDYAPDPDRPR